MKHIKHKVIGISGISGSGKSTLAKALALRLNATLIAWDEYDDISISPTDYVSWHEAGCPEGYAAWKYPQLAKVLQNLKSGKPIASILNGIRLDPTPWIIFDAPLGRQHVETGQFIDFHVHIDIPLDIALGRRLLRDFTKEANAGLILEDIKYYLEESRPLFTDSCGENAELVIDGQMLIEDQLKLVLRSLLEPSTM